MNPSLSMASVGNRSSTCQVEAASVGGCVADFQERTVGLALVVAAAHAILPMSACGDPSLGIVLALCHNQYACRPAGRAETYVVQLACRRLQSSVISKAAKVVEVCGGPSL